MNTIKIMLDCIKQLWTEVELNTVVTPSEELEALTNEAIALGEAEVKRRQDAITAVEFWISCNTDKQDAYCALLKLLKGEIK